MTRYTLHVPAHFNDGAEPCPHALAAVRRVLTATGFDGRTTIAASGEWKEYPAEPMHLVIVDTDREDALIILRALAADVRRIARQEGVYLTYHSIETEVI